MNRRSGALAALAAGGLLVAHRLAYALDAALHGPHPGHVEHGYLGTLAAFVLPACATAAVWLVVTRAGRSTRLPRAASLAVALVGVFLVQEFAERALSGVALSDALADTAIWWGVLFQTLIARALLAMTRAGRVVVERLTAASRPRQARVLVRALRPVTSVLPRTPIVLGAVGRRGPPLLLA